MSRDLPEIRWPAVLVGGAAGLLLALLLSLGPAPLGAVAVPLGTAAGAAVAGRLGRSAGAFHGALVAVLWILADALGDTFAPAARDLLADTARTLLADVGRLALGLAFGWLGARIR